MTLTVKTEGPGNTYPYAGSPGGIQHDVAQGANITLEPRPDSGAEFTGWTYRIGTGSVVSYNQSPLVFNNVTANIEVTANFSQIVYTLNIKDNRPLAMLSDVIGNESIALVSGQLSGNTTVTVERIDPSPLGPDAAIVNALTGPLASLMKPTDPNGYNFVELFRLSSAPTMTPPYSVTISDL